MKASVHVRTSLYLSFIRINFISFFNVSIFISFLSLVSVRSESFSTLSPSLSFSDGTEKNSVKKRREVNVKYDVTIEDFRW